MVRVIQNLSKIEFPHFKLFITYIVVELNPEYLPLLCINDKNSRSSTCCDGCCCSIDIWGITLNIILQDAPFLAFRLLIIIHYRIISYMNVFFTCKYYNIPFILHGHGCVVRSAYQTPRDNNGMRHDPTMILIFWPQYTLY